MRRNTVIELEIRTHDLERSIRFYEGVFGWHVTRSGEATAAIDTGALPAGALLEVPRDRLIGVAPHVVVEDCRATTEAFVAVGGQLWVPLTQLGDGSWLSHGADPWGNELALWQPAAPEEPRFGGPSAHAFCALDLFAPKPLDAARLYEVLLGWRFEAAPSAREVLVAKDAGLPLGVRLRAPGKGGPRGVLPHVATPDVARTLRKATEAGGRVLSQAPQGAGATVGALLDPTGARLGLRRA
jgi:predicted enzyme related to lactoylglutathione lyase